MIDGKINETITNSRREKGVKMGNQIYIKGTKLSIINGNVDGTRRYGIATIEGRTYSKIHGLRITNNDGIHEIGLPHGLAYVDFEQLINVSREVSSLTSSIENQFNTFLIDRFIGGFFEVGDTDYLRALPVVCGVSSEETFIYQRGTFVLNRIEGGDGVRTVTAHKIDRKYMSQFFRCASDGRYYNVENFNSTSANGRIYELSNYESLFSDCISCGDRFHRDDLLQTETDGGICRDCDYDIPTGIRGYGHKPELFCWDVLNGSIVRENLRADKDLLGFELEVQFKEGLTRFDQQKVVSKINNTLEGGFLFCVNDGSINGNGRTGVEIVSHPMSYEFFTSYGFEELFKLRGQILGWNVSKSCGIHVHLNRSTMSGLNQYKIAKFLNHWKGFAFKVSQRSADKLRQWAKFSDNIAGMVSETLTYQFRYDRNNGTTDFASLKTLAVGDDRYLATNFSNRQTLELRIFRSSMNEQTFRKNIEFAESMREWAKVSDLTNFLDFKKYWKHVEESGKFENLVSWVKAQNWGESFLNFPAQRVRI